MLYSWLPRVFFPGTVDNTMLETGHTQHLCVHLSRLTLRFIVDIWPDDGFPFLGKWVAFQYHGQVFRKPSV